MGNNDKQKLDFEPPPPKQQHHTMSQNKWTHKAMMADAHCSMLEAIERQVAGMAESSGRETSRRQEVIEEQEVCWNCMQREEECRWPK